MSSTSVISQVAQYVINSLSLWSSASEQLIIIVWYWYLGVLCYESTWLWTHVYLSIYLRLHIIVIFIVSESRVYSRSSFCFHELQSRVMSRKVFSDPLPCVGRGLTSERRESKKDRDLNRQRDPFKIQTHFAAKSQLPELPLKPISSIAQNRQDWFEQRFPCNQHPRLCSVLRLTGVDWLHAAAIHAVE